MNIILKTVERCNINCDYCYFFQGPDQSYRRHPPTIQRSVIEATATFLAQGIDQLALNTVAIVFHGGEPMLQRPSEFDWMCSHLRAVLGARVSELRFGLQTNATLVNEEWLALFHKHSIAVGVSLDGPRDVNDLHRVDFAGRGTYDRTIDGINKLQQAIRSGSLPYALGVIAVINPSTSAASIFDHFVDVLGVRTIHWELPDANHDRLCGIQADAFGQYLCDLFDAWTRRDDPSIYVRIVNSVLAKLSGRSSYLFAWGEDPDSLLLDVTELTIASNGDIGVDDGLRQTGFWTELPHRTVWSTSLSDYIRQPQLSLLRHARTTAPTQCRDCVWEQTCGGGPLVNRWGRSRDFDNPSVYCDGLKQFYSHLVAYLVRHGVPLHRIAKQILPAEAA